MKRGTIFITFILTSIFWLVLFMTGNFPLGNKATGEENLPAENGCAAQLIGRWIPEEEAENELEFTKYNTLTIGDLALKIPYEVSGNKVILSGLIDTKMRVVFSSDDTNTYLEIYDAPELAGKYRKAIVREEPTAAKRPTIKQPAAPAATPRQKSPQPVAVQPPQKPLAEAIIGKWAPVEGAKHPVEITKYGTFIQWCYGTVDMRYDYTISGDKITIKRCGSGRVEVTTTSNGTYLEIYEITEFSGKYKKE